MNDKYKAFYSKYKEKQKRDFEAITKRNNEK